MGFGTGGISMKIGYDIFINGEHDGTALKMTLAGNNIYFEGYTPDKPIEIEVFRIDTEEKYCIVIGRKLTKGIFWQVVWYSEEYEIAHMSEFKNADKFHPELRLAQYFSMNKCYEIIVDHNLNLVGDYIVIKQAGTENELVQVNEN